VLAQQVMMAAVDRIIGAEKAYSMDQWPGYEYERRRVLRFLRDRYVSNPVVLTGDIHSNWANELTTDFDGTSGGRTVAAEFVGTSISSGGDGVRGTPLLERLQRDNPFVKYQNGQRGYVRVELTRGCCRADYRVLDYVTRPGSPVRTGASFLLEPASSRLHRI
jgi:alkaline phosphatase D